MSKAYFSLSTGDFLEDWSNIGSITTNDDWSGVPSIVGYLGDGLIGGTTGTNPGTITGESINVDVIANQTNPNTFTSSSVAEFHIANPTIALQGSGSGGRRVSHLSRCDRAAECHLQFYRSRHRRELR